MLILEELCQELKISHDALTKLAKNAPRKYRVYTIPKRTVGYRTIAHPSKDLKKIQRALSRILEKILPVHVCNQAYKLGSDIKINASLHADNPYLLKMDFHNYFNSITPELFWNVTESLGLDFDKSEIKIIENFIFWRPGKLNDGKLVLSVGAPISPLISNFISYNFDSALSAWCRMNAIIYTRYADDLTFSTNIKNTLFIVPKIVSLLLHNTLKGITINEIKTVFSSKKNNMHVTGITITNEGNLSIGRARKRYICHLLHQYTLNNLDESQTNSLRGLLAFAEHIQPGFKIKMKEKYTNQIDDLF